MKHRTKSFVSLSASRTKSFAKGLAADVLKKGPSRGAVVLALQGDLGGGKTTFVQGLAEGLGVKEKILSPTFIIMKRFLLNNSNSTGDKNGTISCDRRKLSHFYHIDCYRIKDPKEILALGFKEIMADSQNIVAIEWAEKIKSILRKNTLWLKFEFKGRNKRKIVIK